MSEQYTNVYAKCRHATGMTQEAFAEAVGISVESIKAYELFRRLPPNAVVVQMVAVSGQDWLALKHLEMTSEGLDVLPHADVKSLPLASIRLINKVMAFADRHRDRQLLTIAEDGRIDEAERPLFASILRDLEELTSAALEVRFYDKGCE